VAFLVGCEEPEFVQVEGGGSDRIVDAGQEVGRQGQGIREGVLGQSAFIAVDDAVGQFAQFLLEHRGEGIESGGRKDVRLARLGVGAAATLGGLEDGHDLVEHLHRIVDLIRLGAVGLEQTVFEGLGQHIEMAAQPVAGSLLGLLNHGEGLGIEHGAEFIHAGGELLHGETILEHDTGEFAQAVLERGQAAHEQFLLRHERLDLGGDLVELGIGRANLSEFGLDLGRGGLAGGEESP
jgi:hypothetical protein